MHYFSLRIHLFSDNIGQRDTANPGDFGQVIDKVMLPFWPLVLIL